MGDTLCLVHMLPNKLTECAGYRSMVLGIARVLMNSPLEHMDHVLYGELMSQLEPNVTH